MARKQAPSTSIGPDWFLVDWMRSLKVSQATLGRETGWSKATVNDIYHGKTSYYRQIVNEAARALHIQPHELLMHPDEAMAIRRMRESALQIAADTKPEFSETSNVRKLGAA